MLINILKDLGNQINYEKFTEYFENPDAVIDADTEKTMRDSEQSIRKIVGTYRLKEGDHWMRFKDVSDGGTGKNTQFDQDYIELVPTGVINNPLKPEDIY